MVIATTLAGCRALDDGPACAFRAEFSGAIEHDSARDSNETCGAGLTGGELEDHHWNVTLEPGSDSEWLVVTVEFDEPIPIGAEGSFASKTEIDLRTDDGDGGGRWVTGSNCTSTVVDWVENSDGESVLLAEHACTKPAEPVESNPRDGNIELENARFRTTGFETDSSG